MYHTKRGEARPSSQIDLEYSLIAFLAQFVVFPLPQDDSHQAQLWTPRSQALHKTRPIHVSPCHPEAAQT